MPSESRTRLDLSGIGQFKARVPAVVKSAMLSTAILARDDMKDLAPKDTEQLADSLHIATSETSDYGEAMAMARTKFDMAKAVGKTPKGIRIAKNATFSGLEPVEPESDMEVWIVCGMPYGPTIEYTSGKAFMRPGLLMHVGTFTNAIRKGVSGISVKSKYSEYSKL